MRMFLMVAVVLLPFVGVVRGADAEPPSEAAKAAQILRNAVPEPTAPLGYVFNLKDTPTFTWRDGELVATLGAPKIEEVAWFDASGERSEKPDHGGRWVAVVRSQLPDGRTILRSATLFARPEGYFLLPLEKLGLRLEEIDHGDADAATTPLATHRDEVRRLLERLLLEAINGGDPRGARLAAALHDAGQDDADERLRYGVEERTRHCELKARIVYLSREVRDLPAPRQFEGEPASELHEETDSPLSDEERDELDRICQGWADESGSPFTSLIAHRGGILHYRAFTPSSRESAIDLDFRADVFSISKSISGMLATRFLDAGFFQLDDPVSKLLPDFDQHAEHAPTFRQCLRHQSGLTGHGSWGGVSNVWFDHLVLNGIDTLQPGERKYAGDGFDLVGSAMQLTTGETTTRLFHRGFFEPLGLPPMPQDQMGAGARPTVYQLAALGQILANGGRYGSLEFFSRQSLELLLPTAYDGIEDPDPDNKNHFYGLGIRWVREHRDDNGEPLFSRRTLGHGSFSHSVFMVGLEQQLVIAQVRGKNSGKVDAKWFPLFLREVSRIVDGR